MQGEGKRDCLVRIFPPELCFSCHTNFCRRPPSKTPFHHCRNPQRRGLRTSTPAGSSGPAGIPRGSPTWSLYCGRSTPGCMPGNLPPSSRQRWYFLRAQRSQNTGRSLNVHLASQKTRLADTIQSKGQSFYAHYPLVRLVTVVAVPSRILSCCSTQDERLKPLPSSVLHVITKPPAPILATVENRVSSWTDVVVIRPL